MCSDSEAYGLKKHGLTRSDCRCSVVGVYRAYISRNLSSCPPCSTCQSKEPSIYAKLKGQLIPVGMGPAYTGRLQSGRRENGSLPLQTVRYRRIL